MGCKGVGLVPRFLRFVDNSPSPYHGVQNLTTFLEENGFKRLVETNHWEGTIQVGGRYFFTRNASTIIAFAIGGKYKDGNGFRIIGAHMDSPCIKLKPSPTNIRKEGCCQVGVQLYGGGLWYTWFDRDLKVAGRVVVRENGKLFHRLVHLNSPMLRIPSLCIHMNRSVNQEGFKYNLETDLVPIIATSLDAVSEEGEKHSVLFEALAKELGVSSSAIVKYDLCLADCQVFILLSYYMFSFFL